jgi:hypothetical protein
VALAGPPGSRVLRVTTQLIEDAPELSGAIAFP